MRCAIRSDISGNASKNNYKSKRIEDFLNSSLRTLMEYGRMEGGMYYDGTNVELKKLLLMIV